MVFALGAFGVLWFGKFVIFNKILFVHHPEELEDIPEPGTSVMVAEHPVEIMQVQNRMVKVVRILPPVVKAEATKEAA